MSVASELSVFFVSDLAGDPAYSVIQSFLANTLAHYAIGMTAGLAMFLLEKPIVWLLLPLALIVLKEIFFDVPNSWGEPLVIADSIWDVFCYLFGFAVQFWAVMAEPREAKNARD